VRLIVFVVAAFGAAMIGAMIFLQKAPHGLWGLVADRYGWQVFPLARRLERRTVEGEAPTELSAPLLE
jgi:hypothetical protein